ncbi:MAG: hypothetical protein IJ258_03165 [Methanobrevibacter sp.]|uniref:hypothetical protein n=1 Tax=Methanobrevibacter sp. TaxID=66852 RepID=UPI0025E1BC2D|nr:hypothetical protein [Methanobrevibacter sp.]MBQ8017086.1 hypothetical protein [Methanobrevibacter sp.]
MISLRKINGILVVIIILMLIHHAVLSALFLYGVIDYSPSFKITGRRLFYPLVAHIIISLYLFIKDRRKNVRIYSDLISETNQQIITGIGIIVFVSLHIISYMFPPANFYYDFGRGLLQLIIDGMMFTSICLHLRVSIPRMLVSFGMLESKNAYSNFKRKFNIIILIILIFLIMADIVRYGVLM